MRPSLESRRRWPRPDCRIAAPKPHTSPDQLGYIDAGAAPARWSCLGYLEVFSVIARWLVARVG
jgi:hypothetical protein